jgi:hypothetical protein
MAGITHLILAKRPRKAYGRYYDEYCEDGMESSVRWNLPNLGALDLADGVEDSSTSVTNASPR